MQIRFYSNIFLQPPYISKCFSFTLFVCACLSLSSILYFTSVSYPPNFSLDSTSSWSSPISFHIFSTTLSHHIPGRPFAIFSHTALSTMAGNIFSGIFFTLYYHCSFPASLFVLSGYNPSSALDTVIPVVLEHPSIFLAAVVCTVSNCFTNFTFPFHTSPAYSDLVQSH